MDLVDSVRPLGKVATTVRQGWDIGKAGMTVTMMAVTKMTVTKMAVTKTSGSKTYADFPGTHSSSQAVIVIAPFAAVKSPRLNFSGGYVASPQLPPDG